MLRTAGLYAVGAAGLWGASEVAVEALGLPPLVLTVVVVASIAGFPFALVLSWFFQVGSEGHTGRQRSEAGIPRSRAIAVGITAAVVAFVALGASMALRDGGASREPGPPSYDRTQVTFLGNALDPALSPDGRHVAFHASFGVSTPDNWLTDSLMVVVPGESDPRALAAMQPNRRGQDGFLPRIRWTPDGSELWYSDLDSLGIFGTWRAVPVEGGPSRQVLQNVSAFAFSPDGRRIVHGVFPNETPAVRIRDLTTGEERDVSLGLKGFIPVLPDWSRTTGRIALLLLRIDGGGFAIWSLTPDGDPNPRRLAW